MATSKTKSLYNNFIEDVVQDCLKNLSDESKEQIRDNPFCLEYHFGYCQHIRNHYIYDYDFSDWEDEPEPDSLSSVIMNRIISALVDYDLSDMYLYRLYSHGEFVKLRKEYYKAFGKYPNHIVDQYRTKYPKDVSKSEYIMRFIGMRAPQNDEDAKKESVIEEILQELRNALNVVDCT